MGEEAVERTNFLSVLGRSRNIKLAGDFQANQDFIRRLEFKHASRIPDRVLGASVYKGYRRSLLYLCRVL